MEINADYPDGLLMHDATYSLLSGSSTTKNLDLYLQLFDKTDTILILYPAESTFVDAYYTEYNLLTQYGYRCYIGTEKDVSIS